ncbi:NifB/NifX family molybdenum-iron cluster-binding protein [Moorella sp. Hama-1]|uniref:NifB/NifX family molybdenum-iron cluster-binding protein n=1 Tax=Moorella sp. Hama-1 TaxID=2138101 RepID=UPI000D65B39A|nr:NifB/NifX family molybdenum-iron cluster-binding protein [Moorella sp. Hama-1]BCV21714.1 dinitrogenase iron-molybdenum cofactor biosynthesis [Moorella sp. Hama-1]
MQVAITAQGNDLAAATDPRFGRCQYFVIADTEKGTFTAVANDNLAAGGGAGVATAQVLVNRGVEVVLTGNVGPNALRVLQGAGIKVYSTPASTVQAALQQWQAGGAAPLSQANVGSHFGMGRGGRR